MKNLKLFLLLVGVIGAFFACQHDAFDDEIESLNEDEEIVTNLRASRSIVNEKPVYMPLDSVPEWVKEKVSSKEYKLWKTLSSKFKIEYSILEYPLTKKQKKALYSTVSAFAKNIEKGEITKYMGLFSAANLISVAVPRTNMLKSRSEGDEDEVKYHDTGLHEIYYSEEARTTLYVGAEYYTKKDYAEVLFPYFEVSSAYNATYSGYPSASYMPAYQAICFTVGGGESFIYMHPQHGLSTLYFSVQELYVPVSFY